MDAVASQRYRTRIYKIAPELLLPGRVLLDAATIHECILDNFALRYGGQSFYIDAEFNDREDDMFELVLIVSPSFDMTLQRCDNSAERYFCEHVEEVSAYIVRKYYYNVCDLNEYSRVRVKVEWDLDGLN